VPVELVFELFLLFFFPLLNGLQLEFALAVGGPFLVVSCGEVKSEGVGFSSVALPRPIQPFPSRRFFVLVSVLPRTVPAQI